MPSRPDRIEGMCPPLKAWHWLRHTTLVLHCKTGLHQAHKWLPHLSTCFGNRLLGMHVWDGPRLMLLASILFAKAWVCSSSVPPAPEHPTEASHNYMGALPYHLHGASSSYAYSFPSCPPAWHEPFSRAPTVPTATSQNRTHISDIKQAPKPTPAAGA